MISKKLKQKILIVEDDKDLLRAISLRLEKIGYIILLARDGETAINSIKKNKPDLILLDLILPKKDGFEVLKILKSDSELKNIPVIVLSNLGGENDIKEVLNLGALDYFVKSNTPLLKITKIVDEYLKK